MNKSLREEIVRHVLANLGVLRSDFVSLNKSHTLLDKDFLTSDQIKFDGDERGGHVWGCQLSTESQEVKILLGDCSQEKNLKEFALLVCLKDNPCYGLYYVSEDGLDPEALIACSVNGKEWLECNTFLQASFLTGMEQIKETGLSWTKCKEHKEEFKKLLSFIEYHQLVYGASDEGQED